MCHSGVASGIIPRMVLNYEQKERLSAKIHVWGIPFYLGLLILVRSVIQIRLYRLGFLSVSADEFARGIRAFRWSQNPHLDSLSEIIVPWLPLEKYINAFAIRVWGDVIIAPRITVFLASCILIVFLFLLVKNLFSRIAVAALTVLLVSVEPWFVWLSGTPMLEMYFLAFFFASLYFLVVWLKEQRPYHWLIAGALLFLTSTTHIQSWVLISIVNIFSFVYWVRFLKQKNYRALIQLTTIFALSYVFIGFYIAGGYYLDGVILKVLANHESYSRWFYEGYNVALIEKFLYFPKIVERNVLNIVWLLVILGVLGIWLKKKDRLWRYYLMAIGIMALFVYSLFNVFSSPPSAAPNRYSLMYSIFLTPYIAFGIYWFFDIGKRQSSRLAFYAFSGLAIVALAAVLWPNGNRLWQYPRGMPTEPVAVGRYINQELSLLPDEVPSRYVVEVLFWEFLAVQLSARHLDDIVFDRPWELRNRDERSYFLQDAITVSHWLRQEQIELVALRSPEEKARAERLDILTLEAKFGDWVVYRVNR